MLIPLRINTLRGINIVTKSKQKRLSTVILFFQKFDAFCSQKRLTYAKLYGIVCVAKKVIQNKGSEIMRKKLLTNGNVFKRTDGRWGGVVWYMDEQGFIVLHSKESICAPERILQDNVSRSNDKQESNR